MFAPTAPTYRCSGSIDGWQVKRWGLEEGWTVLSSSLHSGSRATTSRPCCQGLGCVGGGGGDATPFVPIVQPAGADALVDGVLFGAVAFAGAVVAPG